MKPAAPPLFSVVVPTYARPERLRACLEGLAAVDYPTERFEVIVADDGGSPPAAPVVEAFRGRLRLTLVNLPNGGPAAARNAGAERAKGAYLAFTDDDCVPAPDWLAALAARFERSPGALLGGGLVNALPRNPFSTVTHLVTVHAHAFDERLGGERFFSTSNLAVPAARFSELGGFSRAFPLAAGEDYDFCARWLHRGYPAAYAPEAVVRHAHPLTICGFFRQHFNYGRGLFRCRRRMARRAARRLETRPLAFYLDLLRSPLARDRGPRAWLHVGLVGLSQAATLAGAGREAFAMTRRRFSARRLAARPGMR